MVVTQSKSENISSKEYTFYNNAVGVCQLLYAVGVCQLLGIIQLDFLFSRQEFNLREAFAMLEEDIDKQIVVQVREIFITPPKASDLTDEDSSDEDEDEGFLIDNLARSQLCAPAEIVLENNERISGDDDMEFEELHNFKWIDGDLVNNKPQQPKPNYSQFLDKTVIEVFEMFLDDAIINFLVEESNRYAGFVNCPPPNITAEEMKCFIGILYLSGYVVLPGKRFYWDTGLMRNKLVSEAMHRDRFLQIMRFLHCADNSKLDKEDKMCKLRPLINMLKSNFLEYFVPVEHLNYDEALAICAREQYVKGIPIQFGYKVWCLNTDCGYLVNFEIHQGNSLNQNYPLVKMLDELPNPNYRHQIYFNKFVSGFQLFDDLRERGYGATGKISLPKSCPISDKKILKRGAYETKLCAENGVLVARWNKISLASTVHGIHPLSYVAQIPRPHIVSQYNKHMKIFDKMRQDMAEYKITIRGNKWYWSLFTWLLDVALHNAWISYKQAGSELSKLDFQRELVIAYLNRYKNPPKGPERTFSSRNI